MESPAPVVVSFAPPAQPMPAFSAMPEPIIAIASDPAPVVAEDAAVDEVLVNEPAVIVAAPEVAAELAEEIAAPQYGIGLQLFEPLPDATTAAADVSGNDDDTRKA